MMGPPPPMEARPAGTHVRSHRLDCEWGGIIQRVMQSGELRRVGMLDLTEPMPPKQKDFSAAAGYTFSTRCALGILANLSKAWRINVAGCYKNCVEVELKRKSDGFKMRAATVYIPPRGSVNYSATGMKANFVRGDKCDILVGDFNFRPTGEAVMDIWNERPKR